MQSTQTPTQSHMNKQIARQTDATNMHGPSQGKLDGRNTTGVLVLPCVHLCLLQTHVYLFSTQTPLSCTTKTHQTQTICKHKEQTTPRSAKAVVRGAALPARTSVRAKVTALNGVKLSENQSLVPHSPSLSKSPWGTLLPHRWESEPPAHAESLDSRADVVRMCGRTNPVGAGGTHEGVQ